MAEKTLVIEPEETSYEWEGWGSCLAWWANTNLGLRRDLADAFFGTEQVEVEIEGGPDKRLPGLGLNIVRYNLGGSTWPESGEQMWEMREGTANNVAPRKFVEGYWPADGSDFDWNADETQRAMLLRAKEVGADTFEMFSVSPLWWMTESRSPTGAVRSADDNLRLGSRRNHCRYIASVTRHARDAWGIRFTSVEPFNEPSADFWSRGGKQEGCHVSNGAQEAILGMLRNELDAEGLGDVLIAASDENTFREAKTTWDGFPDAVRDVVGRVNVHGYARDHDDPSTRQDLRETVGQKTIWQSEVGDNARHGLYMAYDIHLDLTYLRSAAWTIWQPVETSGWGLLDVEFDDEPVKRKVRATGSVQGVNNRYYVLAQYSRHIRRGMRILRTGDQGTVAAYDPNRKRLALVSVNDGGETDRVTYDLRKFSRADGQGEQQAVRVWVTDAITATPTIGRQYSREPSESVTNKNVVVDHGPETITTLEVDNVEP